MKKNMKIFLIIAVIVVAIVIVIMISKKKSENIQNSENISEKTREDTSKNSTAKDNTNIEKLKEEYQIEGDSNIYDIAEDFDGRKFLTVKPSLNLKVAFSGMIKGSEPKIEEVDNIYEKKFPQNPGIYIEQKDGKKILEYLNSNKKLKCSYKLNQNGAIEIEEKEEKSDLDKKIEKILNNNKTYILSVNGVCYMVDPVTGEVIDNPYVDINKEQTYEYFEDDGKTIIFITNNKEMDENEIFDSIINLME